MTHRDEPAWRRYLTFWRSSVDRDLDAELRFHFDERVADLIARGRTETEAREQANHEFGDRDLYRARMREIDDRLEARRNRGAWIDALRADVGYSLRSLARAPGLTLTVVLLLALGVGANGAIFSMLDRIFLRPPPGVAAPLEVRRIYGDYQAPPPMRSFISPAFNYPQMTDMSAALGSAIEIAAYRGERQRLGTSDESPIAQVADVIGDYFGVLGVRPWRGRVFTAEEVGVVAPHPVAVVSHRFWSRHLGADSTIIGKSLRILRQQFVVIGIAPPGFDGIDLDAVDIWRPANHRSAGAGSPWYQRRDGGEIWLITRIPRGTSELAMVQRANHALHAADDIFSRRTTVLFGPIMEARGPDERGRETTTVLSLAAVTLIVLLTATANVANMLLTRAMQRRREIAVRVALGISRRRLAAQLVTESVVLAVIAGTAATILAAWGGVLVRGLLLPDVQWSDGQTDYRLVAFTFAIALAAGAAAGILPLVNAGSLDLASAMRGGARDGGHHRSRMRATLIVVQAALSVLLLTGAALFLRSLGAVHRLDIGFDAPGMVMARILSGERIIPAAERASALIALRERVATLPGVRAAGLSSLSPVGGFSAEMIYIPGRDSMPKTEGGPPTFMAVSPEFFRASGIDIVMGRAFTNDDRAGAPKVIVVTETMARFIWGGANPIGQCVRIELPTAPCSTVVGVMEDIRRSRVIEERVLQFYMPLAQAGAGDALPGTLVVGSDPASVARIAQELRPMMLQVLPGSRAEVMTMSEKLEPQYRPWRIGASLFTAFGLLAVIVAGIGVYSAMAYSVTQRRHELGVRLALGAQRTQVSSLVVRAGLRTVGAGVILGVVASLAMGRLIESQLYGTSPRDPTVLACVSAFLLLVAVVAAAVPAWHASRVDPVRALRGVE